jgi:hypothetical protein
MLVLRRILIPTQYSFESVPLFIIFLANLTLVICHFSICLLQINILPPAIATIRVRLQELPHKLQSEISA